MFTFKKNRLQDGNKHDILQARLLTAQDQIINLKEACERYQKEFNMLAKRVSCFCGGLLNSEVTQEQIKTGKKISDMDVFLLLDFTEQHIKEVNSKEKNTVRELSEALRERKQEIEGLKTQISQLMMKEQQAKDFELPVETESVPADKIQVIQQEIPRVSIIEDEESEPADKKKLKSEESSPIILGDEAKIIEQLKQDVKQKNEQIQSQDIMAHIVNLNDYIINITDVMWDIIAAIGKLGLSESKDLKKVIVKNNVNDSAFNTSLAQLRKMNIIEQEKINAGWRWFNTYEITSFGKRIYYEKFKVNPVEGEKQLLQKEHTTALHGYCIKDTAYILQAVFGYDSASVSRKENAIKLLTGEIYIPDIVARKKQGNIVDYIEVELGHHTQKDFNQKCDKMRMVTKDLYFVVPDADTMNRILTRQVGQWILEKGGKEKLKGVTIYITTTTKLNESKWEIIYSF